MVSGIIMYIQLGNGVNNMVLEQDDTIVKQQNAAFVIQDRKQHNEVNATGWDDTNLALVEDLYTLVQAAYWETTYKPNIDVKKLTVKVNKGQFAQADNRAVLNAFIKEHNIIERTRNKHRFFDITK